ncbi:MAG: porin [bacterium]
MKAKWLAALGVLSSSAAWAQSSVTLYGVVDANVEYTTNNRGANSTSGASRWAEQSGGLSPSRWGMRGAEDLGGGNKVVFALESGFGLNSGTMQQGGRLFGRQAWVGLEGQGQRLTLGRQYTSLFDMLANFSPTSYAGQYEPVIGLLGPSLREDNMVKYRGLFGPLTAEAHWAFGGQPGAAAGSSAYGAGMDYTFGPLELAAAYDELHGPRTASGYGVARKVFAGARYGISDRTVLLGGFRYGRNDMPAVGQITRDNLWWFGVRQDVTDKISLIGALYYDNIKHATMDGVESNPKKPWQLSLIASYALSKRTDVYVTTAYTKHSALDFENYNGAGAAYTIAATADSQFGAAVGIRHKF